MAFACSLSRAIAAAAKAHIAAQSMSSAMQRAITLTSVSFKQDTAQWLQLVTQALHASIQALNFSCDIKMLRGLFGKARQKPVWLTLQVSQYCP